MANPFDQFDQANPFDQFDGAQPPSPTGGTSTITGQPMQIPVQSSPQMDLAWTEDFVRPALEAGGSVAGGLVGSGVGPGGTVAGGGLGYAGGKQIADLIYQRQPASLPENLIQTGKDIATGAAFEMGGQALLPIWRNGKMFFQRAAAPFSGPQQKATQMLAAHTSEGAIYAQNAAEAAAIEKEIPGLKFTLGQRTYDPKVIKLERATMRAHGDAATINAEQIAANNEALAAYYQRNFGGAEGIDDVITSLRGQQQALQQTANEAGHAATSAATAIPAKAPQQTGADILEAIEGGKQPVKRAMAALEEAIPDYPMAFNNTSVAIGDLLKSKKLSAGERKAVIKARADLAEVLKAGKTTHTAMGARRTLNDEISRLFNIGDDSAATSLMSIRNALEADLNAVTAQARTGKMKLYKGGVVYPDELASQFEQNAQQIASLEAQTAPDINRVLSELEQLGIPTTRVAGETTKSFKERITAEYARRFGKPAPTMTTGGGEATALAQRNKEIKAILSEVEPGQDVAAAMNAYNDFASREYFQRFGRGATAQATMRGQQSAGTRTRLENIPQAFTSPSGADDLIRAIGKDEAAQLMKGHAAYDLLQNTTTADGQVVTAKLNSWFARNRLMLEKYGITRDFANVAKAQSIADAAAGAAADFEKSAAARLLKADPEKAIAAALSGRTAGTSAGELMRMVAKDPAAKKGLQKAFADHVLESVQTAGLDIASNPLSSPAKFKQVMAKYTPAMRVIYRDEPQKILALQNMRRAYEIMSRNTRSPIGGGSDTAENLLTELAKKGVENIPSKTVYAIRAVTKIFAKHSDEHVNAFLTRAMFDPDYAQTMLKSSSGKANIKQLEADINSKIVSIDEYRNRRAARAVAGTAAAIRGSYGDTD
jgi:hypothetical protein